MIKSFPHEDLKSFKDAIQYTERQTGFSGRLIEKDYFCSVILTLLYAESPEIFFKCGTLLNKVHAGFYRLSEDLDFTISVGHEAKRSERSKKAAPFKPFVESLAQKIAGFQVVRPLTGSNGSVQYNAEVKYTSVLTGIEDRILFEIGLREEVSNKEHVGKAATLAVDPYSDSPLLPHIEVRCLSLREAFAEKIRAALARQKVAIRDVYDVWHAVEKNIVNPDDEELAKLVAKKMTIPEPLEIRLGADRKVELTAQIETQLKPVLRGVDFKRFKFDDGWAHVLKLAEKVKPYLGE
jgi:predicted nucleotidyltransferase component of viral defense system